MTSDEGPIGDDSPTSDASPSRSYAGSGYFVDATVSQPESVILDLEEFARPPTSRRVLPLLVFDLKTRSQHRQKMHLTAFLLNIAKLSYVEVQEDDAVEFLVLLFTLVQRRWGHTTWQTTINRQVSDLAFSVMCHLLTKQHRWLTVFLSALKRVMAMVGCTDQEYYKRETIPKDVAMPPQPLSSPTAPDGDPSGDDDESDAEYHVEEAQHALEVAMLGAGAVGADDPFLRSFHSVHQEWLGTLSEGRFKEIKEEFELLDTEGSGQLPISVLCSNGATFAGQPFNDLDMFRKLDKDDTGTVTLQEVLQILHPDVPFRFLARRVAGDVVCDDVNVGLQRKADHIVMAREDDDTAAAGRPGSSSSSRASTRSGSRPTSRPGTASGNSRGGKSDTPLWGSELTPEVAGMTYDAFASLDTEGTGRITMKQLQRNSGMVGERRVARSVFAALEKGTGGITLHDLCREWYPNTTELEGVLREAEAKQGQRMAERLQRAVESEAEWEREAQMREAAQNERIEEARREYERAVEMKQAAKAIRKAEAAERERKQREEERKNKKVTEAKDLEAKRPCIPLVRTCADFPKLAKVSGMRVTASMLSLDSFFEEDTSRTEATRLLEGLDAAGINVHFFCKRVFAFLPRLLHDRCKVYRDFSQCPQRSKQQRRWAAPQTLHFKTNIRMRSDIKYRFHFEGFNWGTNQPINCIVVGSAGQRWDRLDNMEYFGWPTGWDSGTRVTLSGGFDKVEQYYSSDGYVTVRFVARVFLNVGISASAWLVTHGYGAGYPLTATWHHQEDSL